MTTGRDNRMMKAAREYEVFNLLLTNRASYLELREKCFASQSALERIRAAAAGPTPEISGVLSAYSVALSLLESVLRNPNQILAARAD